MEKLIITPTVFTPAVVLDHEAGLFVIRGESRPQDAVEFYGQIINWMNDFNDRMIASPGVKAPVIFDFSFEYFNSGSAKCILDICKILARLRAGQIETRVRWYYEKDDTDMLEAGNEMSQIVKFPFEYVETDPE
jgi:isocitrate dehydrogenase kinase/phosphatase